MSRLHQNKPWSFLPKYHSFTAYWESKCTSTKFVRVYVRSDLLHSPLSYLWTVLVRRVPLSPDRGLPLSPNSVLHVWHQISTERPPPFIVGLIRYLPAQVLQAPGASAQHHPGRLWIKGHVHMSETCPQKSGGEAHPTHNGRARWARGMAWISLQLSHQAHPPPIVRTFFLHLVWYYQCTGVRNRRGMPWRRGSILCFVLPIFPHNPGTPGVFLQPHLRCYNKLPRARGAAHAAPALRTKYGSLGAHPH